MTVRFALAAALLAALPAVPPAALADACDPEVAEALFRSSEEAVDRDLAVIRHPGQGIRQPDSLFDLSCARDMFDFGGANILFDASGLVDRVLDLGRKRVCAAAREAYARSLGQIPDPRVYLDDVRKAPGVELRASEGFSAAVGTDGDLMRRIYGGPRQ